MSLGAGEVDALRETVRAFLTDRASMSTVRAAVESEPPATTALWSELGAKLGLPALGVPESYGGLGGDFPGQAAVLEELGRALAPVPFLTSAVLATQLLLRAADEAARCRWLPRLAAGAATAAVALVDDRADWLLTDPPPLRLDHGDDRATVSGRATYVSDVDTTDVVLVVADGTAGWRLAAVDPAADRLTANRLPSTDPTRPLYELAFDGVAVDVLGGHDIEPGVRRALDTATVALACEQLGGAQRVLDITVAHAGTRVQFDRAIGSFQSVKHLLADAFVENEAAASAVRHAASLVDAGTDAELSVAASVAKSAISDAYWSTTRMAVQVHGAIGFTWEHDMHLFLRRALVSRVQFGSAEQHRERIARFLLDGTTP
jgi:alkylation response protein AidB-like acyl-CoA dehydrogenase